MRYVKHVYTTEDIAELVGKSIGAVRADICRGKLDMDCLLSVLKYVAKYVYLGK